MPSGKDQPEIYIECITHSGLLKVTAIHGPTGTEATVFGPATAAREALTRNAVAKLAYLLKKNAAKEK